MYQQVIKKLGMDAKTKVIWEALLASYNTNRRESQKICNEDADPIWAARAKRILQDLDKVNDDEIA